MKKTAIEFLLEQIMLNKFCTQEKFKEIINQAKEIELQMVVDFTKWYDLNYFVYNGFSKTTKVEDMFKIFLKENANKT